jgi:hypothetical protein
MNLLPILPSELLYDARIITRDLRACHPDTQLVTLCVVKCPVYLFVEIMTYSPFAAIRGFELNAMVHFGAE